MNPSRLFLWVSVVAGVLALGVVVLGAYVRLSDAGLGCPDWPGCYGQLTPPAIDDPAAAAKAWKEMAHRYAASTLGLLILVLGAIAWRRRREVDQPLRLPALLLPLVAMQGLLGMWTVTLLLKPLVVTLHLLGGMTILDALWLMVLRITGWLAPKQAAPRALRRFGWCAFVLLGLQLALGGWTSSNYAALACPDLPTCQGVWWPEADFGAAFLHLGALDAPARVAIHLAHRLGAASVALALGSLALWVLIGTVCREWRLLAWAVLGALALQLGIGVLMVAHAFPLALATLHNTGAALLLLATTALLHSLHGHDRVRS